MQSNRGKIEWVRMWDPDCSYDVCLMILVQVIGPKKLHLQMLFSANIKGAVPIGGFFTLGWIQ